MRRIGDWHDFFVTAAGAAAALAGLMFVGVSINLEKFMANPRYGLAGRALEALVLLVAVLIVTFLLLVPAQGTVVAGLEVLVVEIADWAAIVVIQLLQLRNWHSLEATLLLIQVKQLAPTRNTASGDSVLSPELLLPPHLLVLQHATPLVSFRPEEVFP